MRGLTVTKQIRLDLSADQWELYASSYDCSLAAHDLNTAIELAVNAGLSKSAVYDQVMPVFRNYSNLGAMDSEPMYHLEAILDAIFPQPRRF